MVSKQTMISNALKEAKEMERIMIYLFESAYKVQPAEGVVLSNRLLQLSVQVVDNLEDAMKGDADSRTDYWGVYRTTYL